MIFMHVKPLFSTRWLSLVSYVAVIIIALSSCGKNGTYQEYKKLDNNLWPIDQKLNYEFKLSEKGEYDVVLDIRYAMGYPYNNLYLKYDIIADDTVYENALVNMQLFHKTTGKPLGDGLGDIIDHKVVLASGVSLDTVPYQIDLQHFMREKKLPYIMALGVQINKTKKADL